MKLPKYAVLCSSSRDEGFSVLLRIQLR